MVWSLRIEKMIWAGEFSNDPAPILLGLRPERQIVWMAYATAAETAALACSHHVNIGSPKMSRLSWGLLRYATAQQVIRL
jgi:hypothetical protein